MNQKGFGIKEFVIIIAVIFICIIIIMSLYQSLVNKNHIEQSETQTESKETEKVTYQDLENKLEKAAERYQNDTYQGNTQNTEIWTLSYSMLKEEKYIDKLIDPNDKNTECTGYVEFVQDGAKISYTPFLKCGNNYQTQGYDENNLN